MNKAKLKLSKKRHHVSARDVKSSAAVGNAVFAYYLKHGKLPDSSTQSLGVKEIPVFA